MIPNGFRKIHVAALMYNSWVYCINCHVLTLGYSGSGRLGYWNEIVIIQKDDC